MDSMKRKMISVEIWSKKRMKCITEEKSSIENFSNELFYEIFDYLDGWDLYRAFANLNQHFQQLLHSSLLRLKIKLSHWQTDNQIEHHWKQMIHFHQQQILSMNLSFIPSTMNFSSFNHIQSLTLHYIEFDMCVSILLKLTSLPCLSSLTIYMDSDLKDLNKIYRIILALPMLKYFKFSANECNIRLSFPIARPEQFNVIEILVIDHPCYFEELAYITSYTPHLRQLHVIDRVVSRPKITKMSPTALINLTHLTMVAHTFQFKHIELLIKRMNFKLKVFDIRASDDLSFFNADRWEQLIVQYLPYLQTFSLFYQETIVDKVGYETYRRRLNQFLTSFWLERQWCLDIDIDDQYSSYSVQPYRKKWYENSPIEFSKSTELFLAYKKQRRSRIIAIKRALKISQIYHLKILNEPISIEKLLRIILLLPDLQTFVIHSLVFQQSTTFSVNEMKNNGKISKVYLIQLNSINDIDFLIAFCPALTYFEVSRVKNMTVEFYLRYILKKIDQDGHRSLRSLCFSHPTADDQLVRELKNIIVDENLLENYSIKRVLNEIYLKWI